MLKKQNRSRNIQINRTKKQCDFNESAKLRALRAQVSYVHHALRAFPVLGFLVPHLPRVLPAFVLHVPLTLLALVPFVPLVSCMSHVLIATFVLLCSHASLFFVFSEAFFGKITTVKIKVVCR